MQSANPQLINLDFEFTPKQALAYQSPANEIFWGGAAGGGKSIFLRFLSIILAVEIPNLQIYLFRRTRPDLIKTHVEGPKGYRALLAPYIKAGLVTIVEDECRFNFNGSKIYFCHCKDEEDKNNFLSTEMHVLLIDELTTFTETIYTFLRSRVRATGLKIPEKYKQTVPRILCTSNPGNVGHQWVKQTFVDGVEPMEIRIMDDEQGGMTRQYIPARITDNPFLMLEDPKYISRLKGMGSPALVKAYLEGDWNIVKGQYFPEFGPQHQIEPFEIPKHWTKGRGIDWGSSKPFNVGWYAISTEPHPIKDIEENWHVAPPGTIFKYREWSGEKAYNVGLKLTVEQVADGILDRDCGDNIDYSIADSSMFDEDGGPSQIEQMQVHTDYKLIFFKADKRRIPGWSVLRSRLVGGEGTPGIFFFKTCYTTIRDIPQLQHSELKPEDCDSESSADHSCFVGETLVRTPLGDRAIRDLAAGDLVIAGDGEARKIKGIEITKKSAKIIQLTFSNGAIVKCTPEHKFFTKYGWIEARSLLSHSVSIDRVVKWKLKLYPKRYNPLMVLFIAKEKMDIFNTIKNSFIGKFGHILMVKSQKDFISTILMRIRRTIKFPTFNYLIAVITLPSTAITQKTLSIVGGWGLMEEKQLQNGIALKKALNGIKSTTKILSTFYIDGLRKFANNVGMNTKAQIIPETSVVRLIVGGNKEEKRIENKEHVFIVKIFSTLTALIKGIFLADVKSVKCLSITSSQNADVYCLTEPVTHSFQLASGLVVSNCDETRYFVCSRPYISDAPPKPLDKPKGLAGLTLDKLYELNRSHRRQRR